MASVFKKLNPKFKKNDVSMFLSSFHRHMFVTFVRRLCDTSLLLPTRTHLDHLAAVLLVGLADGLFGEHLQLLPEEGVALDPQEPPHRDLVHLR